ncbi:TonB C-terminal domain-containing protein [Variovorax boronicumulans]
MLWMVVEPVLASSATGAENGVAALPDRAFLDFDLPTQPLASALQRYAVIADQTVLFSDALVAGRLSGPVKGRYAPQAALVALLAGTGLVADNPGGRLQNAFVLKQGAAVTSDAANGSGLDRRYDGLIQMRVWQALCADPRTVPGNYQASLRLNVDSAGQLASRLIGSTGDAGRDKAVVAALNGLRMDDAPPSDLRQPLMLVILPSARVAGRPCETGGAS